MSLMERTKWRAQQVAFALRRPTKVFECTFCGHKGLFFRQGERPFAKCGNCGSLERHRLFALWMADNEITGRVLHFAPENFIADLIKDKTDYVSADIQEGRADMVLNIEQLDLPDADFDAIICFHVLEHVDDGKALSEMFRVLKPGGRLLLMFPIIEGWDDTYEDPSITDTKGRTLHFGQWDHIRFYGRDVRERILAAGFTLDEYTAVEPYVHRHGLRRGMKLFIATKPKPDGA